VLEPWLAGGIHHVGSTAVPGLAAKPIVDMIAGVRNLDESRAAYGVLRELAYGHAPHRPAIAHHFTKPGFSLHLTEEGSDLWRERLAFRDALLTDTALSAEYEALKRAQAERYGDDLDAYTAGKRELVGRVLRQADLGFGRR
jgi:GrpB-like predicted nucleotidyltransferase (UPF0157 family)